MSAATMEALRWLSDATLIIGASRGIGFALAVASAERRTTVATVRDSAGATALRKANPSIRVMTMDVANDAAIQLLKMQLLKSGIRVNLLIHNAGINTGSYTQQRLVNAEAPFRLLNILMLSPPAAILSKRSDRRVCVITSELGNDELARRMRRKHGLQCERSRTTAEANSCAYVITKQEANAAFRYNAPSWALKGIVAAAIHPGFVATAMSGIRCKRHAAEDPQPWHNHSARRCSWDSSSLWQPVKSAAWICAGLARQILAVVAHFSSAKSTSVGGSIVCLSHRVCIYRWLHLSSALSYSLAGVRLPLLRPRRINNTSDTSQ